jgi:integration host factor subunit alpha
MALTKADIVEAVQSEIGFTRNKSIDLVETLLKLIKSKLESGEDVLVSGFGKFQVNEKAPRKGRNPATGGEMILGKRRIVTFKCAGGLKDRVNKN